MAATVQNWYYNGAGPSGAQATNLRFKLADNNTQDANNPCVKPAAGTNRSWWKCIKLYASVAPDTAINNVKIYSDGSLAWTGCTVQVGDETQATYRQATTGGADTGTELVAGYTEITAKTSLFTYTSGAVKDVSGSIGATTGNITDYVVLQLDIGTSAVGGAQAAETITWRYDET
ncbi:MAG: hypothetical protein ACYS1A_17585 [Planctomycetota bacterium]|jgi:hypothetical protein